MREHAPVYWDEVAQVWGIARYDDVLAIAKDPATFCNRHGIRPDAPIMPYMIDKDGSDHRKRRALVHKGFTPRRVQEHEPRIRAVAIELIERAKGRGRFDFVMDLAAWLPLIVIGDLLGVDPADHERLLRWSDDLMRGLGSKDPAKLTAQVRAALEYREYCLRVVASRRAQPPADDLMSILVHAEIEGARLDDESLFMESLLILIGGDETTRHVISGGMHQLLLHPDQRRALCADPRRIPRAIEEMLRWVSPIQNMMRTAVAEAEVGGHRFRPGDRLLLMYPSGNRDEAVFADPFRFDVARDPNPHVAFGGRGAHHCLGSSLARIELQVMFEELLRRFPEMELASEAPPALRPANFVVGIEELPVRFPTTQREA
jgi:cytochrome P450 family 142 subfamily A polypeptide 1